MREIKKKMKKEVQKRRENKDEEGRNKKDRKLILKTKDIDIVNTR